jgi:hypothetical protein
MTNFKYFAFAAVFGLAVGFMSAKIAHANPLPPAPTTVAVDTGSIKDFLGGNPR